MSITDGPPTIIRTVVRANPQRPTTDQVSVSVEWNNGLPPLGQAMDVEFPGVHKDQRITEFDGMAAVGAYSKEKSLLSVYVTIADQTVMSVVVVGQSRERALDIVSRTTVDARVVTRCVYAGQLRKDDPTCAPGTQINGTLDPTAST